MTSVIANMFGSGLLWPYIEKKTKEDKAKSCIVQAR